MQFACISNRSHLRLASQRFTVGVLWFVAISYNILLSLYDVLHPHAYVDKVRQRPTTIPIFSAVYTPSAGRYCFVRKWIRKPIQAWNMLQHGSGQDLHGWLPRWVMVSKSTFLLGAISIALCSGIPTCWVLVTETFELALLYRNFSDRQQNFACDILGEEVGVW